MRRSTYFPQFSAASEAAPPGFEPLGSAEVIERTPNGVRLRTGRSTIEVTALANDLFRVGLFADGRPVDYRSEAVARADWPALAARVAADGTRIETSDALAILSLDPLRIGFEDSRGRQFAVDDPTLGMGLAPLAPASTHLVDPLGSPALVYKQHLPRTHYFGCGERTGGLEKTASRQVFWNVDPPLGHTAALNNLYTSVPFVLALQDGQAWGMFVDSSYRLEFDLANQDPWRCGFAVDGGPLIYYVFAGPTPRDVVERYTELTGRIPMPPRWALGYHQSRWGYKTADELLALARTFRQREIPLDVVYLDIDYMDGYRVFTWDPERFPDPKGLIAELDDLGVKLVTILDPGIKVDEHYSTYISARDADLFCKTFTGDEYHNVVWPGMCAFPDFTNPRTRTWWGDQLPVLLDAGVAGIWCDMNEPTVFVPSPQTLPDDVVHHGEREAALHAQVHNLYGQLMARATHEGLLRLRPGRRPFVISRSGFAGLQRHALRPLLFEFPDDATTYSADDQFMVGSALLVAPIARPGVEYRHIYVPRGTWVHYWTGERVRGPAHVLAHAPLGQPAIYVRANTPVPLWPAMVHDAERPADPLTWLVCVASGAEGSGTLFDDAGDGYAFERGEYARHSVRCQTDTGVEVRFEAQTGEFAARHRTIELDVRGLDRPSQLVVDGQAVETWDFTDGRLLVRLPASSAARTVNIAGRVMA